MSERRKYLKQSSKQFVKFAIVGVIGTLVNLLIFFVAVDLYTIEKNIGSILAFTVAVIGNYLLNANWTFSASERTGFFDWDSLMKYLVINIIGLIINLVILNVVDYILHLPYKIFAQSCGIAGAMLFNFIASKFWVFKPKPRV